MIQLIFVILGIYLLAKGEMAVSNTREIKKPYSVYLGIIFLAFGAGASFVGDDLLVNVIFYIAPIVITLGFVSFFSKPREKDISVVDKGTQGTIINFIILLIVATVIGGLFWFSFA